MGGDLKNKYCENEVHGVTEKNHKEMRGKKANVDIDQILMQEVGQFGWFQQRTLALLVLAGVFSATNREYVFTTARINTRCLVPQCEDASNTEFAAPWLANALPSSGGSFDSCLQFANTTHSTPSNDSCPAHLFDASVTLPCQEYVYENKHTVVYDFDLACNEWRRSVIGFSRTAGTFLSMPLTGFVSDRWGRRTALVMNTFNSAWIGLARYWANSYTFFIALEILEGALGSAIFSSAYILVLEIVGSRYRSLVGGVFSTCSALGQICLGLVAWTFPNWRHFTLAVYLPQILTLSYFWILPESGRWYVSKGRYEEAEYLLKEVARINKTRLSEKTIHLLRVTAEEDKKKKVTVEVDKAQEPWLPVLVLRHKQILLRCIVMPVCWIAETMVLQGLTIMSVNISGNTYINFVTAAAVDVPGIWISTFLISRVGRKSVLMGAFCLCTACQVAYVIIGRGNYGLSLSVYLMGKCSIAIVAAAIYVYTTELFPTKYRHRLFAFCSMMGRLGSITAPLMPAISAATFDEMPFVLFGSFALLSGLLLLLTPETLGTKLPDSMEDAENIGRKKQAA